MARPTYQVLRCFLPLVVVLVLVGCGGNFRIALPNGYEMMSEYTGQVWILGPDGRDVVAATVDGYAVIDSVVVGHVSLGLGRSAKNYSKPGYFVLDTKTGQVVQGMDKKEWLARLKDLGVTTAPQLHTPAALRFLSKPWPRVEQ